MPPNKNASFSCQDMARPLQHSMQGVCVSQLFSTNCCLHFKCSLRLKLVHHPTKSTWNLNMEVWKVKFLFKGIDSYSEVPCSFSWERNAVAAAQPIRQPKDKSHTVQIQYDPSVQEIKQLQCHKVFFDHATGPFYIPVEMGKPFRRYNSPCLFRHWWTFLWTDMTGLHWLLYSEASPRNLENQ